MKKFLIAGTLSATLMLTSCATIFTGTRQNVNIKSNPPAADIEVDGIKVGVTPMDVSLKKGFTGQTLTLKLNGYESKTFQPQTAFNAVSVVNFLFIPGFIIDAATGAMMKYDPKVYEITLEPKKAN